MNMQSDDLIRMNKVVRHRLRNSASGLKSSITFLSKELADRLSPSEMEYFPLILNECDAITYITDRMQQLFDPVHPSADASLDTVIAHCINTVRERFPTAAVQLAEEVPAQSITISENKPVSCIITDLLINAIEASPQKEGRLHIALAENQLVLKVCDNGNGLPDKEQSPFLPFFTTRTRHLGLGLTIARKMTALLSGTVDLEDSTEGVTVRVSLPFDKDSNRYGIRQNDGDTVS